MALFHETLSDQSVYLRYFHQMPLTTRVTHERLARVCFVDYDRAMALVAESSSGDILGVGRLTPERSSREAEFALLVSDAWHERGIGAELLRRLISFARNEGIASIFGDILPENQAMQNICSQLCFDLHYSPEDGLVKPRLRSPERRLVGWAEPMTRGTPRIYQLDITA